MCIYIYTYVDIQMNIILCKKTHTSDTDSSKKLRNQTIRVSDIRFDLTNSPSGATRNQGQTSDKDLLFKHPTQHSHICPGCLKTTKKYHNDNNNTHTLIKKTNKQTNKQTNNQPTKQASKQANKQTNKQTNN